MKDDVLYFQTLGAIQELTKRIVFKIVVPSQTSTEDIKEMAQAIIDTVETYEKKLNL